MAYILRPLVYDVCATQILCAAQLFRITGGFDHEL